MPAPATVSATTAATAATSRRLRRRASRRSVALLDGRPGPVPTGVATVLVASAPSGAASWGVPAVSSGISAAGGRGRRAVPTLAGAARTTGGETDGAGRPSRRSTDRDAGCGDRALGVSTALHHSALADHKRAGGCGLGLRVGGRGGDSDCLR